MEWGHYYERGWGFFAHILTARFCIKLVCSTYWCQWWERSLRFYCDKGGLYQLVTLTIGPVEISMFRRDS